MCVALYAFVCFCVFVFGRIDVGVFERVCACAEPSSSMIKFVYTQLDSHCTQEIVAASWLLQQARC